MTGYWDPEFEPSVEEIMDYIDDIILWQFSQFAFFGELAIWGDFPIQSSTWHVEITSGSTSSSHVPPILRNKEHTQFVDVSEVDNGGIQQCSAVLFVRDEGCTCSLSFSLYPESQSTIENSANL